MYFMQSYILKSNYQKQLCKFNLICSILQMKKSIKNQFSDLLKVW